MMDLYPQAKLLSFSSGEVSAKNSKNRRNHTDEKSPLRGDKFNFSSRIDQGLTSKNRYFSPETELNWPRYMYLESSRFGIGLGEVWGT